MSYVEKTGDMFTSDADAYAHGVNVDGLMGAGIAVQFRKRFPGLYVDYKHLCSVGFRPGDTFTWYNDGKPRVIYNIASQDRPGANARLDWFEHGLKQALIHAEKNGVRKIAMPQIGCGIGGLKWPDVKEILEFFAKHTEVVIEVWEFAPSEKIEPTLEERVSSVEERLAKLESRPTGFERY